MAYNDDIYWWLKGNSIGVGSLSGSDSITAVSSAKKIYVYFKEVAGDIEGDIDDGDTLKIHKGYHDAIISRVLEKLYAKKGMMNEAGYWRSEWNNYLKMAKAEVNKGFDGSGYTIHHHDY